MAKAAQWQVEVTGTRQLIKALKVLGDTDMPYLRRALTDTGQDAASEADRRGKGGLGHSASFAGIKPSGAAVKAMVVVDHPGAKPMEFGRTTYYTGYTGRRQKATGTKVKRRGQPARPFVGIKKADQAIGAVAPRAKERIADAIDKEWERIGSEPD